MAWWNTPIWALTVYMRMLGPIQAERQLNQIEAVTVPHMKQDSASRLLGRLTARARREKPKSLAEQLMQAMPVVLEPTTKE